MLNVNPHWWKKAKKWFKKAGDVVGGVPTPPAEAAKTADTFAEDKGPGQADDPDG